jgi:hypothetical protein
MYMWPVSHVKLKMVERAEQQAGFPVFHFCMHIMQVVSNVNGLFR